MADSEDLKLLMSGELDLSRCDFREANLSGMDLRNRNFSHCLLENAKCEGTHFDGSDFRNAKVSFMQAKNANFNDCILTGLHFGYTDLSGTSLKRAKATKTIFQHTKLSGADIRGASLGGGQMDVDTTLNGVVSDQRTDFEGLKVLRSTSRNPLFQDYSFENGVLRKQAMADLAETEMSQLEEGPVASVSSSETTQVEVTKAHIQHLMQNAIVTRLTAQQFAYQIEEALSNVPATNGNELPEPLQTMLEFADVLRGLAPNNGMPDERFDHGKLKAQIAELESLVYQLTEQLADETKARSAAEEFARSDGFKANFRKSAGKAAGVVAVSVATSVVTVGVPTAAVYFLGVDHPAVKLVLNAIGQLEN